MLPPIFVFDLFSISIDIIDYALGLFIQPIGIGKITLHKLESGGKIETVTDAFIGHDGEIYVFMLDDAAVILHLALAALDAESHEYGDIAEIIEVMIDGRNAEGAHAGDEDRAVERADLEQEFGNKSEIIHGFKKPYGEFHKQPGDEVKKPCDLVKAAVKLACRLDLLDLEVEFPVNIIGSVIGGEMDVDDSLAAIGRHFLFYRHGDLNILTARINLLTGDEAVDGGALADHADICRKDQMCVTEIFKPLLALFADILLRIGTFKAILKKIIRAVAIGHDIDADAGDGVEAAKPSAVGTVARHRKGFIGTDLLHKDKHYLNGEDHGESRKLRKIIEDVAIGAVLPYNVMANALGEDKGSEYQRIEP